MSTNIFFANSHVANIWQKWRTDDLTKFEQIPLKIMFNLNFSSFHQRFMQCNGEIMWFECQPKSFCSWLWDLGLRTMAFQFFFEDYASKEKRSVDELRCHKGEEEISFVLLHFILCFYSVNFPVQGKEQVFTAYTQHTQHRIWGFYVDWIIKSDLLPWISKHFKMRAACVLILFCLHHQIKGFQRNRRSHFEPRKRKSNKDVVKSNGEPLILCY